MAGVPQQTLQWLYDVLNQLNYRESNRAYSDLAQALAQHPGLGPRSSVYTAENGTSALLVSLAGTLPVAFRGILYRFPLTVWIPPAYPLEAPIVYVTPTEDMVVRQGQHVSGADGKVYHHYLAGWVQAPDNHNIGGLLRTLIDVFSKEPPVMAKSQQYPPAPRQPLSSPRLPGPAQPQARPGEQRSSSHYGGAQPLPPPPPPKQRTGESSQQPSIASPTPTSKLGRYDAPPPLPAPVQSPSHQPSNVHANGHVQPPGGMHYVPQRPIYQHQQSSPPPLQQYQTQTPPVSGPSPVPVPYQQSQQQHLPPQQQYQPQQHQQQQFQRPQSQSQSQPQPQQPTPHHQRQQQQPQSYQRPHTQPPVQQPKQPAPQQKDLLSEDDPFQLSLPARQNTIPVPSIPPNPEKAALLSHLSHQILQHLHQSINQTATTAIPSLESQHTALEAAQASLSLELNQLTALSAHLTSNIQALTQTLTQANTTIGYTHNPSHPSNPKNIPSIDEIIIPPSVIARQLYDNVSEQRGYESAIYALNDAFVKGRIASELWSRKVRECAREEFRRKWMVHKIGVGLGLEGVD